MQNCAAAPDTVPAAHLTQLDDRAYFWYQPGAHAVHTDWPVALNVPAAHAMRSTPPGQK